MNGLPGRTNNMYPNTNTGRPSITDTWHSNGSQQQIRLNNFDSLPYHTGHDVPPGRGPTPSLAAIPGYIGHPQTQYAYPSPSMHYGSLSCYPAQDALATSQMVVNHGGIAIPTYQCIDPLLQSYRGYHSSVGQGPGNLFSNSASVSRTTASPSYSSASDYPSSLSSYHDSPGTDNRHLPAGIETRRSRDRSVPEDLQPVYQPPHSNSNSNTRRTTRRHRTTTTSNNKSTSLFKDDLPPTPHHPIPIYDASTAPPSFLKGRFITVTDETTNQEHRLDQTQKLTLHIRDSSSQIRKYKHARPFSWTSSRAITKLNQWQSQCYRRATGVTIRTGMQVYHEAQRAWLAREVGKIASAAGAGGRGGVVDFTALTEAFNRVFEGEVIAGETMKRRTVASIQAEVRRNEVAYREGRVPGRRNPGFHWHREEEGGE